MRVPVRSIPACAGEPARRGESPCVHPVYPRVCGGTDPGRGHAAAVKGLSPRVRGNLGVMVAFSIIGGSIPACAGEPVKPARIPFWLRVYPRVCGGTGWTWVKLSRDQGLSPRVRGNRRGHRLALDVWWSIPACAGEPRQKIGGPLRYGVYPRVCGGTKANMPIHNRMIGLSPRVRGNQHPAGWCPAFPGSIPACAGEPTHRRATAYRCAVYPRVCGGTW